MERRGKTLCLSAALRAGQWPLVRSGGQSVGLCGRKKRTLANRTEHQCDRRVEGLSGETFQWPERCLDLVPRRRLLHRSLLSKAVLEARRQGNGAVRLLSF